MPKLTIYVKEADLATWRQAAKFAGENLAGFVSRALREYLDKEEFREMAFQMDLHGAVTKRVLYVWGSRSDAGNTAWGTSFESGAVGSDQAHELMAQMKSDPEMRSVELEERRVYADLWVDRRSLEVWVRHDGGWSLPRGTRIG